MTKYEVPGGCYSPRSDHSKTEFSSKIVLLFIQHNLYFNNKLMLTSIDVNWGSVFISLILGKVYFYCSCCVFRQWYISAISSS